MTPDDSAGQESDGVRDAGGSGHERKKCSTALFLHKYNHIRNGGRFQTGRGGEVGVGGAAQ